MIRCFTILIYDQFVFFDSVHHIGRRPLVHQFVFHEIQKRSHMLVKLLIYFSQIV